MKKVPERIGGIAMFILIVVSVPFLSITTISTSLFKHGIIPNANALPLEIGDDALDFPIMADSLVDDRFNKEEIKELFGQSPSSFLPSTDNEMLETDKPPPPPTNFDLNRPLAEIMRGQGDEIPNQYIVVLKNNFPATPLETASEARLNGAAVLNVYDLSKL